MLGSVDVAIAIGRAGVKRLDAAVAFVVPAATQRIVAGEAWHGEKHDQHQHQNAARLIVQRLTHQRLYYTGRIKRVSMKRGWAAHPRGRGFDNEETREHTLPKTSGPWFSPGPGRFFLPGLPGSLGRFL